MVQAEGLRARAADYRAAAKSALDDPTCEQYLAVAEYLDNGRLGPKRRRKAAGRSVASEPSSWLR